MNLSSFIKYVRIFVVFFSWILLAYKIFLLYLQHFDEFSCFVKYVRIFVAFSMDFSSLIKYAKIIEVFSMNLVA